MTNDGRQRWQAAYDAARGRGQVRDADFTTLSGIEVEPVYGPPDGVDRRPADRADRLAGRVPVHPRAVPDRLPRPGLDDPAVRRLRQRRADQRALQDDPGRRRRRAVRRLRHADADGPRLRRPASLGEVGHCGVAIDSAADMEVLFDGIALRHVTTSMTISGPAVPVFCMYLVAAERQGVDRSQRSTARCRPTSSRSTSRRRSGCSRRSRTCA